jgi:beta-lactamase class A
VEITRRQALLGVAMFPAVRATPGLTAAVAAIEARTGGRLGVAVGDTGSGKRILHRAQERFPMCSTFKFLLAAAVLSRVDAGKERLDRFVTYRPTDLVFHAPVTGAHLRDGGMVVSALCQAAIQFSDNTAANLLLATLGGPKGWTAFARSLSDATSRLDRIEPALNSALPGDPRDTTTPAAMLADMGKILLGNVLKHESHQRLQDWMIANTTGAHRLRAGLPASWRAGDKTGTGANGASNDIAILWPPGRAPILACVYFVASKETDEARDEAIANIGRLVATTF